MLQNILRTIPLAVFAFVSIATANAWDVSPGKRIGPLTLGMSLRAAHHALRGSHCQVFRMSHRRILEHWKNGEDTYNLIYQGGRLIQIADSNDDDKLPGDICVENTYQQIQARYPILSEINYSTDFSPGERHDNDSDFHYQTTYIFDNKSVGLGWLQYSDDFVASTERPYMLIVHRPGKAIIPWTTEGVLDPHGRSVKMMQPFYDSSNKPNK